MSFRTSDVRSLEESFNKKRRSKNQKISHMRSKRQRKKQIFFRIIASQL